MASVKKEKQQKQQQQQQQQQEGSKHMHEPRIVLPGDMLSAEDTGLLADSPTAPVIKLGPGLLMDDDSIQSVKAGVLRHAPSTNKWWVESNQRRYVAAQGESVIGVVVGKNAEHYKVDIGTAQPALLGVLSFEGATKRNKRDIKIGALVYCRVSLANKDMEAELECVNPSTGKSDGYEDLKNGFVIKTSLGLARRLSNPKTLILRLLGQQVAYETAIGMNGRVWINSPSPKYTIMICNAIKNSEFLSESDCNLMVNNMVDRL